MSADCPGPQGAAEGRPPVTEHAPVSCTLARTFRVHRMIAARLLRDLGLYPGQEFLMMRLWEGGPARQSELIKEMGLDPSTMTKMLQRLEQAGHVRRSPDPADRRAVLVEPTEESEQLRTQVAGAWATLEEVTLKNLDPDERATLERLLTRVEEGLCEEGTSDCPPEVC
ncbi:MarR family winged helix-turn-helix transcriptional regulator [Streptomyces solicathayae]|uniref:MarR family winged helix-turn-helix transcriptional regulator n=1 Tax=Streptomyces solicathayae TaxID=3081768 RepID=A0ABZ0M040_9ACTN|nr:MarR family winged helix-turn-helix transcriptional regulator [Streptomyces sp. HUAS YS2]WOX25121.1 MarR family winged helix-turn-helix transcriptional regulator [Streptomyces sp. HUAS YS2]